MREQCVYFESLGISVTYWIGQDAKDNFDILDKAVPDDWWFHLYHEPSCHVIAHLPGKLDRHDLRYVKTRGSMLCRQYSSLNKSQIVMCARVEDVTKSERVGQVHVKRYTLI